MSDRDIARNRATPRYSTAENVARVAWALAEPLFRWSPRPFFRWRAWLLRVFGARLGANVHVYPSTRISMPWNLEVGDWSSLGEDVLIYNLGTVSVGARATISLRAFLCSATHAQDQPDFPLIRLPIRIGDDAWVAAGAFVGPGVTVGDGSVVGAQAVVVRDVPAGHTAVGNPARLVAAGRCRIRQEPCAD